MSPTTVSPAAIVARYNRGRKRLRAEIVELKRERLDAEEDFDEYQQARLAALSDAYEWLS